MRPNAVAADVLKCGIRYGEIVGSLFQQHSSGGVVAAFRIAGAAIQNGYMNYVDVVGMADDYREIRDIREVDMVETKTVGVLD